MKAHSLLFFLLFSVTALAQKPNDQYSVEAGYGVGISGKPGLTGFSHYEIGFRYMVDQYWGIKFDFGSDRFRTGDNPQLGSDYNRYSVQGVHNLGRTLGLTDSARSRINLLAHGGLGYSSLDSQAEPGTDKIGHVIIGATPQLYLGPSLALTLDTSFILNFTQQRNFDGLRAEDENGRNIPEFTGRLFTASVGLTYYFGRNKSNTDWR